MGGKSNNFMLRSTILKNRFFFDISGYDIEPVIIADELFMSFDIEIDGGMVG